jgi:hypothetical protein
MYRSAINQARTEYYGKDLKVVNKLVNMNRKSKISEEMMNELNLEKVNKEAWKKAFVPKYFESEWGHAFLQTLYENKDINSTNNNNNNYFQTSENDFVQNSNSINKNQPNEKSQACIYFKIVFKYSAYLHKQKKLLQNR